MTKKDNSIEFVIAGGLGNQLFMLCAGMYFAECSGRKVTFDLSDLQRISTIHPGLNVYDLGLVNEDRISVADSKSIRSNLLIVVSRVVGKTIRISKKFFPSSFRKIDEIGYIDLLSIPESVNRVEGYFQTWRYFSELTKKPVLNIHSVARPTSWYLKEQKSLQEGNYAALHVRRGDYTNPANRANGILSIEYFRKVCNLLPAELKILIFTDSPSEIRAELDMIDRSFTVLEPPIDSDPVESLLLMAQASHIVISNSTYSWWAATFAPENAVIFAPTKWFELRDDPVDLLPNHWIKVPSEWKKQ
jgi:hypothetical protein